MQIQQEMNFKILLALKKDLKMLIIIYNLAYHIIHQRSKNINKYRLRNMCLLFNKTLMKWVLGMILMSIILLWRVLILRGITILTGIYSKVQHKKN